MNVYVTERILPAAVGSVWDFVTRHEHLLTWWGPEGVTLPDEALDFTRTGPWYSVMVNPTGQRFKVTGEVTEVRAPNLVAFTWGWHDEADQRGHESQVTIEISEAGPGKTRLVVRHAGLPDDASREQHAKGWTSTLRKLEAIFAK